MISVYAPSISRATKDDNYFILGRADNPFHLAAVSFLKTTNYVLHRMMRRALLMYSSFSRKICSTAKVFTI